MKTKIKKYSNLIRPLIVLFDLLIINIIINFFSDKQHLNIEFILYINIFWLLIEFYTKFYNVYRYTHILKLITLLVSQFFVFSLAFLAYFTIFKEGEVISRQSNVLFLFTALITFFKFFLFFLLKKYRLTGKNYRNVIVFGNSKSAQNVATLFKNRQDLGYRFSGFFSDKESKNKNHLGNIRQGLEYAEKENIDEIYCEINLETSVKLKNIREFCKINDIDFSLIPENKAIYSKDFVLEHYGTIPILKPKQLPFERIETHIMKRFLDVLFSSFVIVFLLSWLLPILWVVVKTNSKGKFFFKQKRDGINGRQFYCYKIRSMKENEVADKVSTSKNDDRVTRIGQFIRKYRIDELPQLFNVFKGEMAFIGPRPERPEFVEQLVREIPYYNQRHNVKPGLAGWAQLNYPYGSSVSDSMEKLKFDLYYVKHQSLLLDLLILIRTTEVVLFGRGR